MKSLLATLLFLGVAIIIAPVLSAPAAAGGSAAPPAAAAFAPDTTGLYERRGEIKYTVEYYQQWTPKGNREKALAEAVQTPLFSSKDTYTIRGANGHDYTCFLPEVAMEDELKVDLSSVQAAPLLAPLANICIFRLEGWWTYELCYGKHIRQFHKNAEGKIEAEFSLGLATAEEGREENDFFSTSYVGGTPCDVAQLSRSAQVRVRCGDGEATLISDIKEPSTCAYIIDVHTPLLCKHPKYAKKDKKAHPIRCLQIVEVDPVHSTSSYPTNIRHVASPLRDTDFVFKQPPPVNPAIAELEEEHKDENAQQTHAQSHSFKTAQPIQQQQQQQELAQQEAHAEAAHANKVEDMLELQGKYQAKLEQVNKLLEKLKTEAAPAGAGAGEDADADAATLNEINESTDKVHQLLEQLKALGDVQIQLLDGTSLSEDQLRQLLQEQGIPIENLEVALEEQLLAGDLDELEADDNDEDTEEDKQKKQKDEL